MNRDEPDVYGQNTVFRETGYFLTNREHVDYALPFFNQAIEYTPNDKRALIGRSCARAKLCEYPGALKDIDKALEVDPTDLVSVAHKALNTYLSCHFEEALVMNMRMVPKRKKPDNFTMGVLHCTEAIENCIGARVGRPLRDHFKIIRKLGWKKNREADKPFEPKSKYAKRKKRGKTDKTKEPVVPKVLSKISKISKITSGFSQGSAPNDAGPHPDLPDLCPKDSKGEDLVIRDSLHTIKTESNYVPPPTHPIIYRPLQNYTTNIENYLAEKYLNSMYLDKIFLKNLRYDPGLKCPNEAGYKKLIQLDKEGYRLLCYKQELLRTRRPFYFIKYQEAISTGALKLRQEAELRKLQNMATRDADLLLDKILTSINERKTRIALEYSEKLKEFCDSKPKKVLPARDLYLLKMYKLVSRAYFELYRINREQYDWDKEKRVYFLWGVPLSREPSTDSVIGQFKGIFIDWKKQIGIAEERLRNAQSPEEMAWLYHELSRYHCEVKQYEHARVYARKCITQGKIGNNMQWVMNAKLMIVKINVQQHNRNDAKFELNDALKLARSMRSTPHEEYIEKCLEVIEKLEFDDFVGPKVLQKREKQIVEMMAQSGMKDEVAFLFRKMSAMPASRRMSVLPGVRLEDTPDKQTAAARKMSIMPGAKTDEDRMVPMKLPGQQKKKHSTDEAAKGIGFMELIQYHVD